MEFTNATSLPVKVEAGSPGDVEMLSIIASKATYRVERAARPGQRDALARLVPAGEGEGWPVFEKPFVFEGVTFWPEADFRRAGVDVVVFGSAVAPEGKPVRSMEVGVECGGLSHRVLVTGDRRWKKGLTGVSATEPEAFTTMPLTNDRAFGGRATLQDSEVPHPWNPDGRGFSLSKKEADGRFLPNLEWPDDRVKTWKDDVHPACMFKSATYLDAHNAPEEGFVRRMMLSSFNVSPPWLRVERASDLAPWLRLTGFDASGEVLIPMPPVEGPVAHASIGDLRSCFTSELVTLVVLVPQRVVIATYRCMFRYLFRPKELRSAELRWELDGREVVGDQSMDWRTPVGAGERAGVTRG